MMRFELNMKVDARQATKFACWSCFKDPLRSGLANLLAPEIHVNVQCTEKLKLTYMLKPNPVEHTGFKKKQRLPPPKHVCAIAKKALSYSRLIPLLCPEYLTVKQDGYTTDPVVKVCTFVGNPTWTPIVPPRHNFILMRPRQSAREFPHCCQMKLSFLRALPKDSQLLSKEEPACARGIPQLVLEDFSTQNFLTGPGGFRD